MIYKQRKTFVLCALTLIFICLPATSSAQDDPCIPAYRLSSCETNDSACKAKEDREYEVSVARCRAKRRRNSSPPPASSAPPAQPRQSVNDLTKEAREREAEEQTQKADERADYKEEERTREEAEHARERTRAYNEQKNRSRSTTISTEEVKLENKGKERTRAFNQQKERKNQEMYGGNSWVRMLISRATPAEL